MFNACRGPCPALTSPRHSMLIPHPRGTNGQSCLLPTVRQSWNDAAAMILGKFDPLPRSSDPSSLPRSVFIRRFRSRAANPAAGRRWRILMARLTSKSWRGIPRLPSCSQVLGSFGVFRRIFQVNFRGWQRRPFSAREIAIFEDLDICRSLQCSWKINLSFCARILHRTFHGSFSNKGSSNRKLWIKERKIYSICFTAKLSSKERDCGGVTEILGKFCFYLKQMLVHFQ